MTLNKSFPVCVLLFLCLQIDIGPAIKVTITPKTFSKNKGSTVDVTCNLDNWEGDARDIVLMKIARKGERAIVLLHQNNSISYSAGNADEFPAKGNLKGAVSSNSLQMTIMTPDPEDSGAYTCSVYYTNVLGEVKEHKDSQYLSVEDPALYQINKKLKTLKDNVEQRKNDVDGLKKKDAEDNTKLVDLEGKLDKQIEDVQQLVNKDTDVDMNVKELEQSIMDQIRNFTDASEASTDKAKVIQLENTLLHQAATIRDLTDKLSEFEKKLQSLKDGVKDKVDKKTSNDADEQTTNDILNLKEKVELHTNTINDLKDTGALNGEEVEKLKGVLQVIASKSDDTGEKVSDVEQKLSTLKEETDNKIDKLNTGKEDDLGSSFANLQNTVKVHTEKIKEVTEKTTEANEMTKRLNAITRTLVDKFNEDKSKESSNAAVGFHVTVGSIGVRPTQGHPIKFNEVAVNEGGGFDLTTGVFTAPKAGIYAFMLYLQVPCYECKTEVTIVANNKVMSRFSGGSIVEHDQHSISAVVKLDKGGEAKTHATFINRDSKGQKWALGYVRKSGFSGVLIAAS